MTRKWPHSEQKLGHYAAALVHARRAARRCLCVWNLGDDVPGTRMLLPLITYCFSKYLDLLLRAYRRTGAGALRPADWKRSLPKPFPQLVQLLRRSLGRTAAGVPASRSG